MKKYLFLIGITALAIFLLSCAPSSQSTPGSGPLSGLNLKELFLKDIGGLGFLGVQSDNYLVGFMRLAIFLLIFTLLFEVATRLHVGKGGGTLFSRKTAGVVAFVLAMISAIFMPAAVLAGTGAAYAIAWSLILIGAPVVGGILVVYAFIAPTSRPMIALRILILFLVLWLLLAVKEHTLTTLNVFGGP